MERRPTLLLFTVGAGAEARRRRLLGGGGHAAEAALYAGCLDEARAAGEACGCRVEAAAPAGLALPGVAVHPQPGSTFGERLDGAVAAALARGATSLLVVGGDTPGLDATRLRRALAALADDPDRVVVGPSPDGGLYLLALARPLGDLLRTVSWRRRDTLRSLERALAAAGRPVVLLEPLGDLDRPADLGRWLRRRSAADRWAALRAGLRRLLRAACRAAAPRVLGRPALLPVGARSGRAPPRLIAR